MVVEIINEATPGQMVRELHCWIATHADGSEGIILSRLSRELRRLHGADIAATILRGHADTQAEAAEGDLP